MFDNLSERLNETLKKIRGQGRLTDANIQDTMREVRMALLEADVALPVVRDFVEHVKQRALGREVQSSLTPGQALIKIVRDELITLMGQANQGLNLATTPPAVILMAGLQGSGKTTTVAKLGRWLKENQKKKVGVVSADVYRPAAIQQLKTLAAEQDLEFLPSETNQNPMEIAIGALDSARKKFLDVLIIDTAGRLHIDDAMMREIKELHSAVDPIETLFVVDSMAGQDAANTAKAFNEALALTGVILTKTDGDARGGAALSVRQVTGKPIKFIGVGEKSDALELFHPDRIASRILGMGDLLSLIEEVERKVDQKQAEKLAKKITKGKGFDLSDFKDQIVQMNNMGGVQSLMDKLPGMGNVPQNVRNQVDDKIFGRLIAIIDSMTPQERQYPATLNGSRKRRIAKGSGTQIQDINRLLKQHKQMQKMIKKFSKGNMMNIMRGIKGNLPGRMPF
ncbi:MAG: signal recognition particle protein [Methylococcaceae bacterium]|nr:signal recognition particle protein [Methylococcaceae bacterium]